MPLPLAIITCQLLVLIYLLFKPQYRKEIYHNYLTILKQSDKYFWIKNGLGIGKNLALMIKIDVNHNANIEIKNENILTQLLLNNSDGLVKDIKTHKVDVLEDSWTKDWENVKFTEIMDKDNALSRLCCNLAVPLDNGKVNRENIMVKIMSNSRKVSDSRKPPFHDDFTKPSDRLKLNRKNTLTMKNNSCIVVSFHFGPWELLPQIFSRKGYQILLNVQNQKDERLNYYLIKKRSNNNNIHLIYSLKSLTDKLKMSIPSSILGFVLDNTNTTDGCGMLTDLSEGIKNKIPLVLSRRYLLPIGPMFIYTEGNRIKVLVGETIMPNLSQDQIRENITQQFLPLLKSKPEQWVFWGK